MNSAGGDLLDPSCNNRSTVRCRSEATIAYPLTIRGLYAVDAGLEIAQLSGWPCYPQGIRYSKDIDDFLRYGASDRW